MSAQGKTGDALNAPPAPPYAGVSAATGLKRLTTAVVGVPAVYLFLTWAPERWFQGLVVVLSAVAAWELVRMVERTGGRTHRTLTVVGTAAVTASFVAAEAPTLVLALAVAAVLAASVWRTGGPAIEPAATALLTIGYVGWLLGHALRLRALPNGVELTLFAVAVTWCGETAAWAVGSTLGRHPLAPLVSPRKTMEGAVAQVLVSLAGGAGLGLWLLPQWGPLYATLGGGLLGVVGQVGDLAESVIKRSLGTKDTGTLFPGHGGLLDRLDSLLFNVPALFYYVWGVGGLS